MRRVHEISHALSIRALFQGPSLPTLSIFENRTTNSELNQGYIISCTWQRCLRRSIDTARASRWARIRLHPDAIKPFLYTNHEILLIRLAFNYMYYNLHVFIDLQALSISSPSPSVSSPSHLSPWFSVKLKTPDNVRNVRAPNNEDRYNNDNFVLVQRTNQSYIVNFSFSLKDLFWS